MGRTKGRNRLRPRTLRKENREGLDQKRCIQEIQPGRRTGRHGLRALRTLYLKGGKSIRKDSRKDNIKLEPGPERSGRPDRGSDPGLPDRQGHLTVAAAIRHPGNIALRPAGLQRTAAIRNRHRRQVNVLTDQPDFRRQGCRQKQQGKEKCQKFSGQDRTLLQMNRPNRPSRNVNV